MMFDFLGGGGSSKIGQNRTSHYSWILDLFLTIFFFRIDLTPLCNISLSKMEKEWHKKREGVGSEGQKGTS